MAGQNGLDPLPQPTDVWQYQPPPPAQPQQADAPTVPSVADLQPASLEDTAQMAVWKGMMTEVPAVPRSSHTWGPLGRFGDFATDIAGNVIGDTMHVLGAPARATEQALGLAVGLFYWNDMDLQQRWELGRLTWEQMFNHGQDSSQIMARINAGEDIDKVIKENEGGWADTIMQMAADPLNLFGVPGVGLLAKGAKALGAGEHVVQGLEAINRGFTAGQVERILARGKLPAIPEGMVRLYRGEVSPAFKGNVPDWVQQGLKESGALEARGRWYTNNVENVKWYLNEAGDHGRVLYVDVPAETAQQAHLLNQPPEIQRFSLDPTTEYFLPREMASSGLELTPRQVERGAPAMSRPYQAASDFVIKSMKLVGLNETEAERIHSRITRGMELNTVGSHTPFEVAARGAQWRAETKSFTYDPRTWFRRWAEQTPISKRNETLGAVQTHAAMSLMSAERPEQARTYMHEIVEGITDGSLVNDNPSWGLAINGSKHDMPAGTIGLLAIGHHARSTGVEFDKLKSIQRLDKGVNLADDAEKKKWIATALEDIHKLAVGDNRKQPGGLDHYFGLAGDYGELDGKPVLFTRERNVPEQAQEELDKLQAGFKKWFGLFYMNTPRHLMANVFNNVARTITTVGGRAWRMSDKQLDRYGGRDMFGLFTHDFSREPYQGIEAAGKASLRDKVIKPWMYLSNEGRGIGDVWVRRSIAGVHTDRQMNMLMAGEHEHSYGILSTIDFGNLFSEQEQKDFLSAYKAVRNPQEALALRASVEAGAVKPDPAHYLAEHWLDDAGFTGDARAHALDHADAYVKGQINDIANEPGMTATEFNRRISALEQDYHEGYSSPFLDPHDPTPIRRTGDLQAVRRQNEHVFFRQQTEQATAIKRVGEMYGVDWQEPYNVLEDYARAYQDRARGVFNTLDYEMSHSAIPDAKLRNQKRNGVQTAFDKWNKEQLDKVDGALRNAFREHPQARSWAEAVIADRKATEVEARKLRKEYHSVVTRMEQGEWDPAARDVWQEYYAKKDALWTAHMDRTLGILGLHRVQTTPLAAEEPYNLMEGVVHLRQTSEGMFESMRRHADELWTADGTAPRAFPITPEQANYLLPQLTDYPQRVQEALGASVAAGKMMADHAMLAYDRKYGFDEIMKFVFPWGFWPTRMAHRYFRAAMTNPGHAGALAALIEGQDRMQADLPERLKGKFKIPFPFLPDWMGGGIYVDPVKMMFPFAFGIDPGIDTEESGLAGALDRTNQFMQSVSLNPAPWLTLPLQLTGGLGDRNQYIRYQLQGLPFGLPGTAAQQAIHSFLAGDPATSWQDGMTPEMANDLTLGNSFPEAQIRNILNIPEGDQWDYYRVLRMLANMAGEGTVTPEEALKAAKARMGPTWEKARDRAGDESGVRNLSSWLGVPGTIYPKGEQAQDGLKMMYDAAREADRKAGGTAPDGNTQAFFEAFPEFQVRQVQKALYRGQPELDAELDTSLYYIDLDKVHTQYDPLIAYYEKQKASLPKGSKEQASNILQGLYADRSSAVDRLERIYSKRKETPSVYAPPTERALKELRTQWYKLSSGTFAEVAGRRELFLQRLGGTGIAPVQYDLAQRADQVLAGFDQRLAEASNSERDGLYRQRLQSVDDLTAQAMTHVSREDFLNYLNASKSEPGDAQVKAQQTADAVRRLFSASPDARKQILAEYPDIATTYGPNPDPQTAGAINAWWTGYYALPPNSMARDDYVQSKVDTLNRLRAAVGLAPLAARERPQALPISVSDDPYAQAWSMITAEQGVSVGG